MRAETRSPPVRPYSLEAEEAVLGALLLDGTKRWPLVAPIIQAADFYRPDHRTIFESIRALTEAGTPPDLTTVEAHLERRGELGNVGGLAYLSTLARDTISVNNVEHHARIVQDRSALRRLVSEAADIERAVHGRGSASAETLLAEFERRLAAIRGRARRGSGLKPASDLVPELIDDLDRRREAPTGLLTGLADLDNLTGGFEPGDLVVIAGRPGMGKTALLMSMAAHIACERSVAIFSAEMPAMQLMRRALALVSRLPLSRLKVPRELRDEDWSRMCETATKLEARKIWIDDRPRPTLEHVRAETIALNARFRLACVFVDYIQLLEGHGANRYEQLRDVAYGLKALAKELEIPVIALAQLNRGVESRDQKRANLADLRDSGAIEEAADVIGLLYSEGYYDREFPMPAVIECAIEKNRNGERGQCVWHFDAEHSHLVALDSAARAEYRKTLAQRSQRRAPAYPDL